MTIAKSIRITAFVAASLVSCTQTNAALMDNSVHLARTCPDGVRIYSSPDRVGSEYQEIALLNSTGLTNWTTESGMMKSMRQKAAEVGATGIIMGNIDEPGAGAKVAAQVLGTYTQRKGKSVAIYVAGDEQRIRSVCGGFSAPATVGALQDTRPAVASTPKRASENFVIHADQPDRTEQHKPTVTTPPTESAIHAQASIGAPLSENDRGAALDAFNQGNAYVGAHEWAKAEQSFQRAVLFDGSVAKYHAALGSLMMLLHRWADAEASYSAAVLIDVDNADYRRLLKESRARR
jgi:hypothetical protein